MNEAARSLPSPGSVPPPLTKPPALGLRRRTNLWSHDHLSDREFLAPALEILETPASPVHVAFLWIICLLAAVALGLAYFGRIDIVATAQGKFQPTGRVKVVEPVDTGRVSMIRVTNDSLVKAGDALVELDRSAALADVRAAREERDSAHAEALRRQAALTAARARRFSPTLPIGWTGDVAPALREREQRVLAADLGQLEATIASFEAQSRQKAMERDMLQQTISSQRRLVATLQERVDMRAKLVSMQAGAKAAVIDATETLQYQQTQLATQEAQLASAASGLDVIARDSRKGGSIFPFRQRPEAQRRRTSDRRR